MKVINKKNLRKAYLNPFKGFKFFSIHSSGMYWSIKPEINFLGHLENTKFQKMENRFSSSHLTKFLHNINLKFDVRSSGKSVMKNSHYFQNSFQKNWICLRFIFLVDYGIHFVFIHFLHCIQEY